MNARMVELMVIVATSMFTAGARGEEGFRVESEVYADDQTEPTTRTLTLFHRGQVYDFLAEPREVTLFDRPRGRVILLNTGQRLRTEISLERLARYADQLKARAAGRDDPVVRFTLHPTFEQREGMSSGESVFSSPVLTYRVRTAAPLLAVAVDDYREFSDVLARLNSLLNPHALPPFPRLAVNQALAEAGRVPQAVTLTMAPRGTFSKPVVLRSEHRFQWRLVDSDLAKIAEVAEALVRYDAVVLEEYLRRTAVPTER